jgi:L-arabinose isomerase
MKNTIGLFGIGLETYWGQYNGLFERLTSYLNQIHQKMEEIPDTSIVNGGLVDSVEKANEAAHLFVQKEVSVVFLYISTYALSQTVLPVVQKTKVPVIILNLQPDKLIDYQKFNSLGDRTQMTGEWLANCQACSVPEIACVFNKAGIDFHLISGYLHDKEAWREITDWLDAAKVAEVMRNNRMGFLGHYYGGMLDVYSNLTQHAVFFGLHIEILEMDELKALRDNVTDLEIEAKIAEIHAGFLVSPDTSDNEIKRAALTAVALDKLVSKYNLGSMAYYYNGVNGNVHEDIITSVIVGNSLLTAHHIPVAGEAEVKNVQAMKIMDSFGSGGSFSEFYLMDFEKDEVLMGHDGPGHIAIADGKPVLKPLKEFHGKPGKGVSVEMKVKKGLVTVLAVVETRDCKLKMIYAEGNSVDGPILEIGNTNSRYKFPLTVKQFINDWSKQGPSHHCAIGIGHIGSKIEKLGALLNMDVVKVC